MTEIDVNEDEAPYHEQIQYLQGQQAPQREQSRLFQSFHQQQIQYPNVSTQLFRKLSRQVVLCQQQLKLLAKFQNHFNVYGTFYKVGILLFDVFTIVIWLIMLGSLKQPHTFVYICAILNIIGVGVAGNIFAYFGNILQPQPNHLICNLLMILAWFLVFTDFIFNHQFRLEQLTCECGQQLQAAEQDLMSFYDLKTYNDIMNNKSF